MENIDFRIKKNIFLLKIGGNRWRFGENSINLQETKRRNRTATGFLQGTKRRNRAATGFLQGTKTEKGMATGISWKTRNKPADGSCAMRRPNVKRALTEAPQFRAEDWYITPFAERKLFDEDGRWHYVAVGRNLEPTGLRILDDYLRYLSGGGSDVQAFAARHGVRMAEVNAMIFVLTGVTGLRFRQLYQMRLVDDLLRYTDMTPSEVARRSGLGGSNNLYLALRREYDMSATERRRAVRQEGDLGRYRL